MISCAFLIRGELAPLVQHMPAGPAIAALFRSVPMPGGAVPALRPPAETRPALTNLIAAAPRDAMLYRLRAQQDEMALDFAGGRSRLEKLRATTHPTLTPRTPNWPISTTAAFGRATSWRR